MAPRPPVYFQVQSPAQTPVHRPRPTPEHPSPKLRLKAHDLTHKATATFFHSVDASSILSDSIKTVLSILYPHHPNWPATRSVTLILEDMGGVAYTKGIAIDDMHKEIHLSLPYVAGIDRERLADEITGVMVHEMVHCWQWNGKGTAPGGLIEGVADWVRLKANLGPPHWSRSADGDWDGGYEKTAYFLDYLEGRFGWGSVAALNERLRDEKYEEGKFWDAMFGRKVGKLWKDYRRQLKQERGEQLTEADYDDNE